MDGPNAATGRLEVLHDGRWGSVCDDSFTDAEASVACRQLGLGGSGTAYPSAPFGYSPGPIWLEMLGCTGSEAALEQCAHKGWNVTDCSHAEDVGVTCNSTPFSKFACMCRR